MTLVQLRTLVAIVDAGLNISSAARRIHATQPGLSKQLAQIEGELGFQVFLRRGKQLEAITDHGSEVIQRARLMLSELAKIESLAVHRRRGQRASVSPVYEARVV
jgi:LysR family cys regulon transcriptional activator